MKNHAYSLRASSHVMRRLRNGSGVVAASLCSAMFAFAPPAAAQAGDSSGLEEIIVTAQKRSERINDVPISITAASNEELRSRGIIEVRDLAKIVPGFQYTESLFGTPVYSLRGVGFYDNNLGSRPAVTIYVDEVPLPFSVMTGAATLDLERVEVLKGPQGTLFGQNATGGAVNYIAAKPTDRPEAGFGLTFGRFSQVDANGFVSGPLSSTLSTRLAVATTQSGDWQKSYTRKDSIGSQDRVSGRWTVDWNPTSRLRIQTALSGSSDQSDLPAAQFVANTSLTGNPADLPASLINYPKAPRNNRAADWDAGQHFRRDAKFYQASLRADYELGDALTVTSITAYAHHREDRLLDFDGTAIRNVEVQTDGKLSSFSQELRLSGQLADRVSFVIGGNYEKDKNRERIILGYSDATAVNALFPFTTRPNNVGPSRTRQSYETKAVFGNVDFELTDQITAHGGIRYTKATGHADSCSYSGEDGVLGEGLTGIYNLFRGLSGLPAITPIAPGECVTANNLVPSTDPNFLVPGIAHTELDEHNVSWRAGLDWKPRDGAMLYVNVSKGYKAGSFPLLSATGASQFAPAKQESLLSYEAGFKLSLLDRKVQVNGAAFYYDYSDKQFRGRIFVPPFGASETLLNIPKSRITGAELQLTARPTSGLTLNIGGTYLDSKVRGPYENYDSYGVTTPYDGESFPFTPKWQVQGDVEYKFPVRPSIDGFVGASAAYQSHTASAFGGRAANSVPAAAALAPLLKIDGYATLDLRAGIEAPDGAWQLSVFGRNVTNTYYWSNAAHSLDTTIRFAGRPATYGISFSHRFR